MGIMPLTGIPLPLISHGSSSRVATLFLVGVLLAISRESVAIAAAAGREPEEEPAEARPRAAAARHPGAASPPRRRAVAFRAGWRRASSSRRAAPSVTSRPRWRSPTSSSRAAPRCTSPARRSASRRRWCRRAATRSTPSAVSGFERRLSPALLGSAARAVAAPASCARILGRVRPDVVLGAGGYVAGPMLAAAAGRRIPAALLEADAHLGLANRLAAPLVRLVLLAFPVPGREPPRYRVIGRPVDPAFATTTREEARAAYAIEPRAAGRLHLRRLARRRDAQRRRGRRLRGGRAARRHRAARDRTRQAGGRGAGRRLPGVRVLRPHAAPAGRRRPRRLPRRRQRVRGRRGRAGRPILVPWPGATADHQRLNAALLRARPAPPSSSTTPRSTATRLRQEVEALLGDPARLGAMGTAMRALARPDAARDAAEALLELAA